MRIRSIKPEFWQSETMSSVDHFSRLMAIALLNLSDDHGYFNATPAVVRGEIFPFEESLANISRALGELSRVGYIVIGTTASGKRVGSVVNFKTHQKVDHPSRLTFDVDSIIWDGKTVDPSRDSRETSASPREILDQEQGAGSVERGAWSGEKERGARSTKGASAPRFVPPSEEEWISYCAATWPDWHRSCIIETFAYYQSVGWMAGKAKIKDWKYTAVASHARAAKNRFLQPKNGTTNLTRKFDQSYYEEQA